MTTRPWIFLLMVLAPISGCSLAPGYVQPVTSVPPAWPEGTAYPDSLGDLAAPTVQQASVRDLFPDDRLQHVVEIALANNVDLRLAALNVERVRAYYRIQRSELIPSVNVSGGVSRQRTPVDLSYTGEAYTSDQVGIETGIASWELDLFGRIRNLKDQAWQQYLATEAGRRGAELSLVSAVGQSYLSLTASREQLRWAESTLESQRAAYHLVERQFEAGVATRLDLRRVQTQVNTAEVEVSRLTRQVAQDRNALERLVGVPVPEDLLASDLTSVLPPQELDPGLSSTILLQRPDVMAAEHRLRAANAYIGVARAAYFPRISLSALVGTASDGISGLFGSDAETWTLGAAAGMPLFDLRVKNAVHVSEADREIALAEYQRSLQTAFREVSDALAVSGTIADQVASQEQLVEATAEAYDLARRRFDRGQDSYLSVLDAQRSFYAARLQMVGTRLAQLVNRVQLYAVLGGGVHES